jgi:hypothetical protein
VDLAGPAEAMAAKARMEAAMEAFMLMVGFGKLVNFERVVSWMVRLATVFASSKNNEEERKDGERLFVGSMMSADFEVRLLLLLIHILLSQCCFRCLSRSLSTALLRSIPDMLAWWIEWDSTEQLRTRPGSWLHETIVRHTRWVT